MVADVRIAICTLPKVPVRVLAIVLADYWLLGLVGKPASIRLGKAVAVADAFDIPVTATLAVTLIKGLTIAIAVSVSTLSIDALMVVI